MKKIIQVIKSIWKGQVTSALIAAGILSLLGIIWAWYKKKTPTDIYNLSLKLLNFSIPLYLVLLIIFLLAVYLTIKRSIKRKNDLLYNESVGNYTFRELCQVLQSEKIETQTILMEWNKEEPINADLLSQFMVFAPVLSQGVTFEHPHGDSGYLYALFAPKMETYGLVDKISAKHHSGIDMEVYQLSELGKKFIALVNKHKLKITTNRK